MKTLFLLLISATTYGQVWTSLGAGLTNKYFKNTQPTLFNIRAGYLVGMVHIYAGYVRHHQSNDYKERNYDTWQVGASYNFCYYKRTTFYVSSAYSPKFITGNIGMTYNLFKD